MPFHLFCQQRTPPAGSSRRSERLPSYPRFPTPNAPCGFIPQERKCEQRHVLADQPWSPAGASPPGDGRREAFGSSRSTLSPVWQAHRGTVRELEDAPIFIRFQPQPQPQSSMSEYFEKQFLSGVIVVLMFIAVVAGLAFYSFFLRTKKDSYESAAFICLLMASFLGALGWFLYNN